MMNRNTASTSNLNPSGHQKTLSSGSVISTHSSRLFDALLPLPQISAGVNNEAANNDTVSPEILSSLSSSESSPIVYVGGTTPQIVPNGGNNNNNGLTGTSFKRCDFDTEELDERFAELQQQHDNVPVRQIDIRDFYA